MRDAKPILDKFLAPADYEALGQAVCTGFAGCYDYMHQVPALANFFTGIPQWSHLIRTFVEHALSMANIEGMHFEFRPNSARNCWHARYYKNGLAWTAHFAGGGENKREMPRKAIYRTELAGRTGNLFSDVPDSPEDDKYRYFQIFHAGYSRTPDSVVALIPSHDHQYVVAGMPLPKSMPALEQVEQVKEEMHINLRTLAANDLDEEKSAG